MDSLQAQEAFLQAMNRFRMVHLFNLLGCNLTKGEFFTLSMIHDHIAAHPDTKGIYVSELAGSMQVTSPAVSRLLRTLEQRGLIERSVDRDDRRTTYIVLTKKGEAARLETCDQVRAFSSRVFERMGEADMQTLITLWSRLTDILAEEQAKETKHAETD